MAPMITDSDRTTAVDKALQYASEGMSTRKAADKAAKPLNVTGRTVYEWARKQGRPLGDASHEGAKKARQEARLLYQAQREELKVRMSQLAHDLIDKCYEPHYDYFGKDAIRRDYDTPRSGDIKNYVTSAAILVDKMRLEEGKATERHESLSVGAVEAWLSEQEAMLADADN